MGTWANLALAREDLRRFVNDGPLDRPVKNKVALGSVDGTNRSFMTWDDRIFAETLKVSIDYVPYDPGKVTVDDPILGEFTLAEAPPATSIVRTQYFFRYFLDGELDTAMQMAAQELIESDDVTGIPSGLKLAALHWGGHFAYQKQAMRWVQRMSSRFLLEEEPIAAEVLGRSNLFRQLAKDLKETAVQLRDGFYQRHGRRHAPGFGVYKPRVPRISPRA